jgi:glutaredoxin
MKPIIRFFFQTVRFLLAPVMLLWEIISRKSPVVRSAAKQQGVDQQCKSLVLYQFKTCPFCIKVRKEMHHLALPIARRDAQHDATNRAELLAATGLTKVPCLRITDAAGRVQWMHDSKAIIGYLQSRFASV